MLDGANWYTLTLTAENETIVREGNESVSLTISLYNELS